MAMTRVTGPSRGAGSVRHKCRHREANPHPDNLERKPSPSGPGQGACRLQRVFHAFEPAESGFRSRHAAASLIETISRKRPFANARLADRSSNSPPLVNTGRACSAQMTCARKEPLP